MKIVPVLDIKDGQVVRAQGGLREQYAPISTSLSQDSDPVSVARGLRGLYPFPGFYVADLDAIETGEPNKQVLERLSRLTDAPELWVDAGFHEETGLAACLDLPYARPVLGSESQKDVVLLEKYRTHPKVILSLDFFADGYRGPEAMLSPELWPGTVIVMTLVKVGTGGGPDWERLRQVREMAGERAVYAAGGIRGEQDLRQLAELGVSGALVATALHNGSLSAAQLAKHQP